IGLLGLVHEHDLRIGLDERREPAPRDRIGHVEVDAQLHVSPESRRSTSGAGTPSATPDTTIAATPITRPCASASGPPEFPGARRTSAWTQTSEPVPFSPYPRGNGLTACSTPTLTASLTPRELDVLRLVAQGLGNKEIAAELALSTHTVKYHLASVLAKLGVGSRTEAVSRGIRTGLLPL